MNNIKVGDVVKFDLFNVSKKMYEESVGVVQFVERCGEKKYIHIKRGERKVILLSSKVTKIRNRDNGNQLTLKELMDRKVFEDETWVNGYDKILLSANGDIRITKVDNSYCSGFNLDSRKTYKLIDKKVDFATAMKAYIIGKTIKSVVTNIKYSVDGVQIDGAVDLEIDREWIVID